MFELHNVHSYMLILVVFGYSFPELFYISWSFFSGFYSGLEYTIKG